jgi:putative DNA primase/helicase
MAACTGWWKWVKKGDSGFEVQVSQPPMVMVNMLCMPAWPVPVVERVVEVPVVGCDGVVLTRPGYHPGSLTLYCPPPGVVVPEVPDDPPPEVVALARRYLVEELLGDFPFVRRSDRAQAVAALLLPFCRALFDGPTPLHLWDAPTMGTGKTLGARAVSLPAAGGQLAVQTYSKSEDEMRKKITAALSAGPTVILFDNLTGHIESAAPSAVLTAPVWEDRFLGRNTEVIRLPNRALWLATANNADLAPELIRRTVPIRLDTQMERPFDRDPSRFRHKDLIGWATEQRGLLTWSALVMVRAWVAAGRPPGPRTIGSYERWATTLGGILQVAGIDGFLEDIDEFRTEFDTHSAAWGWLLTALHEVWGSEPFTTGRALGTCDGGEDFLDLGDPRYATDRSRETKLGKALVGARNRVHGGLRLEQVGKEHGGNRWRVVEVKRG